MHSLALSVGRIPHSTSPRCTPSYETDPQGLLLAYTHSIMSAVDAHACSLPVLWDRWGRSMQCTFDVGVQTQPQIKTLLMDARRGDLRRRGCACPIEKSLRVAAAPSYGARCLHAASSTWRWAREPARALGGRTPAARRAEPARSWSADGATAAACAVACRAAPALQPRRLAGSLGS